MKKVLSIVLALAIVLSLGVVALAADDVSSVTITKTYKATNGGVSPAETFTFSDFTEVDIKENPAASFPSTKPSITNITYAEGAATSDGSGTGTATATITLPTYTAVGIYTYSFKEVTPETKSAGVTYNETTLYLVVTVVEDGGKVRIAAVHCEGSRDPGTYGTAPKTDAFENSYESGTLAVSKSVTGNLGDKSKYFKVTVTFAAPDGEAINSTIKYTGGSGEYAKTSEAPGVVSGNSVELYLKDSDTFTFTNVPEGVTWTVVEDDYTADANGGYDAAQYSTSTDTIDAGDADTCTITNNKQATPDTGITLDSLPYVLMAVMAMFAAVVIILNKRRASDY